MRLVAAFVRVAEVVGGVVCFVWFLFAFIEPRLRRSPGQRLNFSASACVASFDWCLGFLAFLLLGLVWFIGWQVGAKRGVVVVALSVGSRILGHCS